MEILNEYRPETDDHRVTIKFTGQFLICSCNPLPHGLRHLITKEQGAGIIQDAVLMAMGYQLKPEATPAPGKPEGE